MNLYCFPFAGGSTLFFNDWIKYFDPSIKIISVELAGRGTRISEPFYDNFEQLINDIFSYINKEKEYAFFGHSNGSKNCIFFM